MAYFTCNNCNYTFSMASAPDSCPDCGKTTAKRIVNNGTYSVESIVPAIRPASEAETMWFRRVQSELASEPDWISA